MGVGRTRQPHAAKVVAAAMRDLTRVREQEDETADVSRLGEDLDALAPQRIREGEVVEVQGDQRPCVKRPPEAESLA